MVGEVIAFPAIFFLLTTGLSLAYFLLLFAHSLSISSGLAHANLDRVVVLALGGSAVGEWIFLGLLVLWLRGQGLSLRNLGWRAPTTKRAVLLGMVVAVAYSGIGFLNPEIFAHAGVLGLLKVIAIISAVTSGLVEEITFRGFVIARLQSVGAPRSVQVLYSGLSYGLVHLFAFSVVGFGFTFVLGCVFAMIYIRARSLTPTIVSHTIIDLIAEPALTMYSLAFIF